MTKSEQYSYQNQWIKENKDTLKFTVPKGFKIAIETHYKALGYKSLNAYVNALISADMERTQGNDNNPCSG